MACAEGSLPNGLLGGDNDARVNKDAERDAAVNDVNLETGLPADATDKDVGEDAGGDVSLVDVGGPCESAADCDDGNPCNGIETCSATGCIPGTPLECDDGDACNGVETCGPAGCQSGTPMDCNDGVSCSVDSCSGGSCRHVADNSRCDPGYTCMPSRRGCIKSACSESPCSITDACGCGAGQACYASAGSTVACMTTGSLSHGARCSADNACVAGTLCLASSPGAGLCRKSCKADADCPGSASRCALTFNSTTKICSMSCDPTDRSASACGGSGAKCDIFSLTGGGLISECGPSGSGTDGASCSEADDCAVGFGCFGGTCRQWCVDGRFDCKLLWTCNPVARFGGVDYGICERIL